MPSMPPPEDPPNIVPRHRRDESKESPAPTLLMQSYLTMGKGNRRFMRRLGLACWAFTTLPIAVATYTARSVPIPLWAFIFLVFFAGFVLIWPQAGVHLIEKAPDAISRLLPGGLGKRPDRRSE